MRARHSNLPSCMCHMPHRIASCDHYAAGTSIAVDRRLAASTWQQGGGVGGRGFQLEKAMGGCRAGQGIQLTIGVGTVHGIAVWAHQEIQLTIGIGKVDGIALWTHWGIQLTWLLHDRCECMAYVHGVCRVWNVRYGICVMDMPYGVLGMGYRVWGIGYGGV